MGADQVTAILVSLLGGGGLAAVIGVLIRRRKIAAESKVIEWKGQLEVVGQSIKHVESLRQDVDRLLLRIRQLEDHDRQQDLEMRELRAENLKLRHKVEVLTEENRKLRHRLEIGTETDGGET